MRFEDFTGLSKVCKAINHAEILLEPQSNMMYEIKNKSDWGYGCVHGIAVWHALLSVKSVVKIKLYTPINPFTGAIAMTNGDGNIYFNSRKIKDKSLEEITGTILHEYAHICGFHHGNNFKTKNKELYSVPYYLSSNVNKWVNFKE